MPKVSVLMSVYNGEKYLREAMDSILNQTFTDFEFIIIDDGSTDGTAAILDSYTDPRIVQFKNEANIGPTRSLNRGLELVRGEYIARMDGDDISVPVRLERQVEFLDQHPEVGLVSAWCHTLNEKTGALRLIQPPFKDCEIRWTLFFDNFISHPTCVFRRALLQKVGLYREEFLYAQDYDLWSRLAGVSYLSNLQEPLNTVRIGSEQITTVKRKEQQVFALEISTRNINQLMKDAPLTVREVKNLRALCFFLGWLEAEDLSETLANLEAIFTRFRASYPPFETPLIQSQAMACDFEELRSQVFGEVYANVVLYSLSWSDLPTFRRYLTLLVVSDRSASLERILEHILVSIHSQHKTIRNLQDQLEAIRNSNTWRIGRRLALSPLGRAVRYLLHLLRRWRQTVRKT